MHYRHRLIAKTIAAAFAAVSLLTAQIPAPGPAPAPSPNPGLTPTPLAATPAFAPDSIVSSLSLTRELSPGMLVTIAGRDLATQSAWAEGFPLPTALGGTSVLVNDRAVPLLQVTPTELQIQLPWELVPGRAQIKVRSGRTDSAAVTVEILRAAPGLAVDENGRLIATGPDGRIISDTNLARPGTVVTFYAAGLGPVEGRVTTGAASPAGTRLTLPLQVTVGGLRAEVARSGLLAGYPGVYEVAVRVPRGGFGVFPLAVRLDGRIHSGLFPVNIASGFDTGLGNPCGALPGAESPLPPGATEVVNLFENFASGSVDSLYAGLTDTDSMYWGFEQTSDGCPVTVEPGGDPGDEVDPDDIIPDLDFGTGGLEDLLDQLAQAEASLSALPAGPDGTVPVVAPGFVYSRPTNRCAPVAGQSPPAFCRDLAASPFGGKDIIYVHDLNQNFLSAFAAGGLESVPGWNGGLAAATYAASYRGDARSMWDAHINLFLKGRGAKNRYLIVGWSAAERLEKAANAVQWQIARAMTLGDGVELGDTADIRGTAGFCSQGCVIVSHGAGALITDVAMAQSADTAYQAKVGPIGFIPQNIRVHVSLGGMFSGTRYASLVTAISRGLVASVNGACKLVNLFIDGVQDPCVYDNLKDTILIDLVPLRTQSLWGPWVAKTPVPVLTVAGSSHESLWPFKQWFLRGYDDGVATMDSACARPLIAVQAPAGTFPWKSPGLWDRGMAQDSALRAFRFWREQNGLGLTQALLPPRAAAGCTPFKSPAGMITKPLWWMVDKPMDTYPNHYAFIQTTENHGGSRRSLSKKDGLLNGETPEMEDVRAITNPAVYSLGLVRNDMKTAQVEEIRGKVRRFKLFGKVHKLYLWKRTYHRLAGWQNTPAAEYVYRFVQ